MNFDRVTNQLEFLIKLNQINFLYIFSSTQTNINSKSRVNIPSQYNVYNYELIRGLV